MVAGGHATPAHTGVQALKDIKRAEEEVRARRADAEKKAEAILVKARDDARTIVSIETDKARKAGDERIRAAVAKAQTEADRAVALARQEATTLRNVPEQKIEGAANDVMQRLRAKLGGA